MTNKGKPALELIEEAVHLLRSIPASVICLYYIGALPFALANLYFWADMSNGAFAESHAGVESLLVVLLFVWVNCWQSVFMAELRARLTGNPNGKWTLDRIGRVAVVQGGIQPTCFLMLPLAALAAIPYGRVFAFYQSVNCYSGEPETDFTTATQEARAQSARWPKQNWVILSILSLFGLLCYINIILVVVNGANLLKSFFGLETMFTRSTAGVLNSTFFGAVSALTYLTVDPLVKAIYTLRCFYGDAESTGEDLRARLRRIPALKAVAAAGVALVLLTPMQAEPIPTADLDRSMDSVIQSPEFSWRTPRLRTQTGSSGVVKMAEYAVDGLVKMADGIRRGIKSIFDWYKRMFGTADQPQDMADAGAGLAAGMRFLTLFLAGSLLLALVFVVFRIARSRARSTTVVESHGAVAIDISSESASADQLPEEEWLRLGKDLIAAGDVRLGIRALYLGGLANLARRELISLAKSKTNRDYQRELERRARATPHVLPAFAQGVSIYERTWYGRHLADSALLAELMSTLDRLRANG